MTPVAGDVSDEILEEACYYLLELGLTPEQVATHLETSPPRVSRLAKSYAARVRSKKVVPGEFDREFWERVKKEAEGDEKLTFMSEKGFHHAWTSELRKLDGPALMSIFEASKDFLGSDPNQRFLDVPPPKGYDPLALEREVRKAVEVIGRLLDEKWRESMSEKRKSSQT